LASFDGTELIVSNITMTSILNTITNDITCLSHELSGLSMNCFHLFLRYLYLNLKETTTGDNCQSNMSSWRTFKGRLYTRLHDKRIGELDLCGIVNFSFIFFVLIKCFSGNESNQTSQLTLNQLRFEQFENFIRMLSVFSRSKNILKLDTILPLNQTTLNSTNQQQQHQISISTISAKTDAIKVLINVKFTALKLYYYGDEVEKIGNNQRNNIDEDIKVIIDQELIGSINNWIEAAIVNSCEKETTKYSHNQIATFKTSQIVNQFICDIIINFIDNCQHLMDDSLGHFYQLAFVSCELLGKILI
jgi:hypothetical protein